MLALAFAVGAGLLWWWRVIVCEGTVRLADGREVGVLALTYGTNHVFVDGKLWVKLARPLLSPAKASQLGLRIYERATDVPSQMVWTHWRLPLTNPAPRFASVVDRHGVESEPGVAAAEVSVPHSTKAVMAWNLASYPRRQGRIVLRFYERDTAYCPHRVGELAVRLSGNGASKTWRAPVPPIRVARDGREFTLVALRGGEPMSAELKWPFTFIALEKVQVVGS